MKRKFKVLVAFSALMICMSSCVYSLFPIYTKDTIVYEPELLGKWSTGDDEGDYIVFADGVPMEFYIDNDPNRASNEPRVTQRWSTTLDHTNRADTLKDQTVSGGFYNSKEQLDSLEKDIRQSAFKVVGALSRAADEFGMTKNSYKRFEGSYNFSIFDDGRKIGSYRAYLVEIGEDYFMDLYPKEDVFGEGLAPNLFPVHTFMKVEIEDDKLVLTQFDLEKMNKLFESNLIRIRHENVDGAVLITARPKEIQKFLDKYSDDSSVFESPETYQKIG